MVFLAVLFCAMMGSIHAAYSADVVNTANIPGWGRVKNIVSAGYLNGSNTNRQFHYTLVQSTVLFENRLYIHLPSAIGCSVYTDFFAETGPIQINNDATEVEYNENGWHYEGHNLYIDAFLGSGFSYDIGGSQNIQSTEEEVVNDIISALASFFVKFPDYNDLRTFIVGRNYTGILAPKVMIKVADLNQRRESDSRPLFSNVEGLIIGNPLITPTYNDVFTFYETASRRGFIPRARYEQTKQECTLNPSSEKCVKGKKSMDSIMDLINLYNIYGDCKRKAGELACVEFNQSNLEDTINGLQAAFHVSVKAPKWTSCNAAYNDQAKFASKVDAAGDYEIVHLNNYGSITFFSGEDDLTVSTLTTMKYLRSIAKTMEDITLITPMSSWFTNRQRSGTVTRYTPSITFYTVDEAGHFAARDRGEQVQEILREVTEIIFA
jgi:carboxypeptidase C (cathepsin A)